MKLKFKSSYRSCCQYVAASLAAPSSQHIQIMFLGLGVLLLSAGVMSDALAQFTYNGGAGQATYNDDRIAESVDVILLYITGSFGALVMVSAGIAAIISSAFGQYRAALGLLVVALGSFILRSLISTWFNDSSLQFDTVTNG
jgi:hypothetical protein